MALPAPPSPDLYPIPHLIVKLHVGGYFNSVAAGVRGWEGRGQASVAYHPPTPTITHSPTQAVTVA